MIILIMRFDPSQSRAIDHFTGPSLILAGPGSGKTTVITQRIHNLIQKYHVQPEKILVATFSKAAATEMQQRYALLRRNSASNMALPLFGTFHGIFYGFLRSVPGFHAGRIISDEKKDEILRTALEMNGIHQEDDALLLPALSNDISRIKSDLSPDEVFLPSSVSPAVFRNIYEYYERVLSEQDLLDFDDILQRTYELLSHRQEILTQLQARFSFYLIDEFQDISRLQYEIIKLLSSREHNLFAVGDDDQAIYSFRGASSGIMKQFLADHPDTEKIVLNVNYRSSYPIMEAALKVITVNKDRFRKDIRCFHSENDLAAFQLDHFLSPKDEIAAIADRILLHQKEGVPLDQMAILCRSTFDNAFIREHLRKRQIPVQGSGNSDKIRNDLLNDFFCYMKTAMEQCGKIPAGSCSRSELLRIINRPSRYISREAFGPASDHLSAWLLSLKKFYERNPVMRKRVRELDQHLLFLGTCSPYAAISYIWNAIGYKSYIRAHCKENHQEFTLYEQVYSGLLEESKEYATYWQWAEWMAERDEPHEETSEAQHGVILMTMHASKGLEFDIVFLPGLNEDRMPHKKATTTEAIREERRLFYVAMTRAKKHLYLSYVENYRSKKATPSRFLDCFLQ
ncbi:MAG: ATP-dependent helicase [Lachnospiraceae bacterium]|nr:ATP-dependent helicase [Lachnospiraceae bacterium]